MGSISIFNIYALHRELSGTFAIKYKHGRSRSPSDTMFIIQSILLTGITYSVEIILYQVFHRSYVFPPLNDTLLNFTKNILFVILSIPVALCLSMVDLCIGKHRLVPDFLKFLRLTDRYGNEDVWEYLLDTKIKGEWVDIRDLENKIMYSGRIHLFSETEKIRELYLLNVIVYDFEGNELYRVPQMYMSRPSETVIMELRSVIEAKGKDDEKK